MAAINGCGFFSLSLMQMVSFASPLWGHQLPLSAVMLGLVLSARTITPLVYSIHFGALMDSIGVRRLMLVFTLVCIVLPVLHPLFPGLGALFALQIGLGLGAATVWLAAQTAVARHAAGERTRIARFFFFTAAGNIVGPPLVGVAWTAAGHWGGFGLISLWAAVLFGFVLALPGDAVAGRRRFDWWVLLPDIRAYGRAWRVFLRPVTTFAVLCALLRFCSISIQDSFYPFYMKEMGFSPATIGMLLAIGSAVGAPASLAAGWWTRLAGNERRAAVLAVALSITAIGLTPVYGHFWMFAVAIAVHGFGMAVSMPLIVVLLSSGIPRHEQGVTAALRATANRVAAFVVPPVMGVVVQVAGLESAFLALAAVLVLMTFALEMAFRRL